MSKCDNCEIRKYIAYGLDLHWMGEDDCPFECPIEAVDDAPTIIEATIGQLNSDSAVNEAEEGE